MQLLKAEIRIVEALGASDIDEMYGLYQTYYGASDETCFRCDLDEKNYVIELRDDDARLRGFSTLALIEYRFKQQPQRAIYSGDTVIHHDFWGSQSLPLAWSRLAGKLKSEAPSVPLYWLLIVKGHRTYRYLTSFAKRYYPHWQHDTPREMQELMDYMANEKFGSAYKRNLGIVRFAESRGHLRQKWSATSEHLLKKPNVRFFLQRNPGYHRGDELVCLTELCADNLRLHVLREFNEVMQDG